MSLTIRMVELTAGNDFSDLEVFPLQALADCFGNYEVTKMVDFGVLNEQAWLSLKSIFGDSLPDDWFNEETKRVRLHAAELFLIFKEVSEKLSAQQTYKDAQTQANTATPQAETMKPESMEVQKIDLLEKELKALREKLTVPYN